MSQTQSLEEKLRVVLERQFDATLDMLGRVIDQCPDDAWDLQDEPAPIWQQLYHSLIGLHYWVRDPQQTFEPQPFTCLRHILM